MALDSPRRLTYRLVHVTYVAWAIFFWPALLESLRSALGVFPGVDAWWASPDGGMGVMYLLFFLGILLGITFTGLSAMIVIRFRRDWKSVLPAGLYLAAVTVLLLTLFVTALERNDLGLYVATVLLVLSGLSATWVVWHWFRHGYTANVDDDGQHTA